MLYYVFQLMKLTQCGVNLGCLGLSLANQIFVVGRGKCCDFLCQSNLQGMFSIYMNLGIHSKI